MYFLLMIVKQNIFAAVCDHCKCIIAENQKYENKPTAKHASTQAYEDNLETDSTAIADKEAEEIDLRGDAFADVYSDIISDVLVKSIDGSFIRIFREKVNGIRNSIEDIFDHIDFREDLDEVFKEKKDGIVGEIKRRIINTVRGDIRKVRNPDLSANNKSCTKNMTFSNIATDKIPFEKLVEKTQALAQEKGGKTVRDLVEKVVREVVIGIFVKQVFPYDYKFGNYYVKKAYEYVNISVVESLSLKYKELYDPIDNTTTPTVDCKRRCESQSEASDTPSDPKRLKIKEFKYKRSASYDTEEEET